ncbi:YfiR family protein [Thioflexithrix psekupsensis]|nr:YfiR family protein [Thioflexithrix psekupsensis]
MNLLTFWLRTLFLLVIMGLVLVNGEQEANKADSLYAVAQYVRWPQTEQPLVFCLIGKEVNLSRLEQVIAGKKIQGRALEAKAISGNPQSHDCAILYSAIEQAGSGILTVSSTKNFAKNGGMVEFLNADGNQFNINRTSADKANIRFTANILKIAKTVY